MTDITELAQSLKAAADREMICRDGAETSEIWERNVTPENILALVEALEKAQAKNALVAGGIEASTKLHERIAELDAELEREREKSRRVMSRIAEMESRTVTVKLPPKIERDDADGWFMYNGGRVGGGAAEWYNKALDDVSSVQSAAVTVKLPRPGFITISGERTAVYLKADVDAVLTAVGIKWEAE